MPVTHAEWVRYRSVYEKNHFSDCHFLERIGGNEERCSTVNGNLNVYLVWATQALLLLSVLPWLCNRIVTRAPHHDLRRFERSYQRCTSDSYPVERFLVPALMLTYLTFALVQSWEVFTLFYFTFLTVSTQLMCNLFLIVREHYEWYTNRTICYTATLLRVYSQILLAHTFACCTFIILALLLFASTNQELLHLIFIYKLMQDSPTILANEFIHSIPVLVYLFLIKTHYCQDIAYTKRFLRACIYEPSNKCTYSWFCFVSTLQIPSMVYILLVSWNCVYGRLAKPFSNNEEASEYAYIAFGLLSFISVHHYVIHRVLIGPPCMGTSKAPNDGEGDEQSV